MSSLQSTIDSGSSAGVLIAMVDAAFVEQAFLVRDELVKCIPSYPDGWKKAILQICLEYRDRDEKYHARLLDAAEGFPF